MKRENERQREERSRVTDRRSQDTGPGEQGQHFLPLFIFFSLYLPLIQFFSPSPLVSNLIFITAESLKQFTWSASDMKIDNCDPPFLPGKQKRRAVVMCECMLSMSACVPACVCEGVRRGSMTPKEVEEEG